MSHQTVRDNNILNKMALIFFEYNFKNKPKTSKMKDFVKSNKNITKDKIIKFFVKFNLIILFTNTLSAQGNYDTFDMTSFLGDMQEGWSIGNGTDSIGNFYGPYFEVIVNGDMDMNGNTLEIMNCKIRVLGDTLFSGPVVKRYFGISELIVEGSTLSNNNPDYQDLKFYLKLYPNPATSYFIVQTNKESKIIVYDILGKVIIDPKQANTYFRFDNYLQAGVYFIKATNNDKQQLVKRLIIK